MNAKEFYDAVVAMREAQKVYFHSRTTSSLQQAKRAEKKVDEEIDRVTQLLRKKEEERQYSFFQDENFNNE